MALNSPRDMMSAVTGSMEARTGRTLGEWVDLVRASGLDLFDQNAVRRWLKKEHGVLQNSAYAIADAAARGAGWVEPTIEEYIDQQYSGPRQALRPIFDRLRDRIERFGEDVRIEGRASYTPFVRARQFAAIAAPSRSRVEIGLRFTVAPDSALLTPANAPGQATHRVSITSVEEITPEVGELLRLAYEQNGPAV